MNGTACPFPHVFMTGAGIVFLVTIPMNATPLSIFPLFYLVKYTPK
jgi:hypothetical protein